LFVVVTRESAPAFSSLLSLSLFISFSTPPPPAAAPAKAAPAAAAAAAKAAPAAAAHAPTPHAQVPPTKAAAAAAAAPTKAAAPATGAEAAPTAAAPAKAAPAAATAAATGPAPTTPAPTPTPAAPFRPGQEALHGQQLGRVDEELVARRVGGSSHAVTHFHSEVGRRDGAEDFLHFPDGRLVGQVDGRVEEGDLGEEGVWRERESDG